MHNDEKCEFVLLQIKVTRALKIKLDIYLAQHQLKMSPVVRELIRKEIGITDILH